MISLNNKKEILRYVEQIKLNKFNFDGQQKIKSSKVAIIGLGGLGCAASIYLVAAGIGEVTLIDFDTVILSNLQRQILHHDLDIDTPKVYSAAEDLSKVNPHCILNLVNDKLKNQNMSEIIIRQQVIIDCTDNIKTREQINLLCYQYKIPLVSGAAISMEGHLSVFNWRLDTPCYRCISQFFTRDSLNCIQQGIMSPIVGIIGAMQSIETIKLLTDYGTMSKASLLIYDALNSKFDHIKINKDLNCQVCSVR
ncbi:molybdopterin-synthase adenylyltransferase MoeB [Candidatus Pantoea edessiphila]|uniref:Molybdopterin-synthase adenylyltransferase MoeB n=1 Tax=Candidatus Pantoea edessiphila TaxID=2044610 RepID=A0A2P5SWZ4_9GAMM|nr:molybdopterin-synthase adenylyltransferase MoeB [Candidatus Pantoea edessiphila]PPI86868.1 molybdopterin-synthase adenylyltransferase MoeB [Candidatus Pantoea edessiphila]